MTATLERLRAAQAPLALAAAALVGTAYLASVDPNRPGHYPLCPIRSLTGYACPGCGMLRAIHDLATGDPGAALHRNPLGVLLLPAVVLAWAAWLRRQTTGKPIPSVPPIVLWALLVVVMAFWLFRNLPGFGWLGP